MQYQDLENLQHFLECYFNISFNYADLQHLARQYKSTEQPIHVDQFVKELQNIKQAGNWEQLQVFVREHGMRYLATEKIEKMVDMLLCELIDM